MLAEELRIGGLEGDEEYTFGSVSALLPLPDGGVLVADRQVPIIRRYDSSGVHLHDVGRGGEGPGEYTSVDGLAITPDGSLKVWDARLRRLSTFTGDGEFVESVPVADALGGFRGFVHGMDGQLFVRTMPEDGFVETPSGLHANWSRIEEDGSTTLVTDAPMEESEGPRYVLAGRGGYYRPFNIMTLSTLGPDGSLYWARNDEYVIYRKLPTGDTVRIVREQESVQATAKEIEQWESYSEMFAERSPEQRDEFFPIPRTKPFMRELVVDPEGRLWVSRYTEPVFYEYPPEELAEREAEGRPAYQWRDAATWDVFDSEGELLGVVTLPLNTTFSTASGRDVWGITAGDFREDYVVKWRIERAGDVAN